jgi:hypothetical protein
LHPATGLQNNLICESHPLLDRASDSIHQADACAPAADGRQSLSVIGFPV